MPNFQLILKRGKVINNKYVLACLYHFVISAMIMPLCAFCHSTYFTLRSGGKTVVTFIFDSVYTWALVIPVAFLLSNFTTLNIVTVFWCVQSMEFVKAVIGYFMVKSNVWLVNIVNQGH